MFVYQGKTALITGASSGIGEAFARALAARGMHLVLVARSSDNLERMAGELRQAYEVTVEPLSLDLTEPGSVERLVGMLSAKHHTVDLLINNAGVGFHGQFASLTPAQDQREIVLNVNALVALTHALLPDMLSRSSGAVINVASTLAFQPTPYMAVYGATKAFVLSFTVALAEESRERGIRVLALCPGPTGTAFYVSSGGDEVFARMRKRAPEQVVSSGLRALERGHTVVIDGVSNRFLFGLTGALPPSAGARILGRALHP